MTTQPEALRLAEWIEGDMTCQGDAEIATELRRLHESNTELVKALKDIRGRYGLTIAARAAINKAERTTT